MFERIAYPLRMGSPLLFAAVLFGACADAPEAILDPPAPSLAPSDATPTTLTDEQAASTPATKEIRPTAPFEIRLAAEGSMRPGDLITINASAKALYPNSDAEFFVFLPEVEAAKATSWDDDFRMPKGEIGRVVEERRSVAGQEFFTEELKLRIPSAGYFRVVATARLRAPGRISDEGSWIQDVATRSIWLFISDEGGRVTQTFDASVFPKESRRELGPFRDKRRPSGTPSADVPAPQAGDPRRATTSTLAGSRSSSCASNKICLDVQYVDDATGRTEPLPDARLDVVWEDVVLDDPGYKETDWTDSRGRAEFDCPSAYYEGAGDVRLVNLDVGIVPEVSASLYLTDSACGRVSSVQSDPEQSIVYVNFSDAIPSIESLTGESRGKILVHVVASNANDTCVYGTTPTERITMLRNRASSGKNCVWGDWGRFAAAHEYGHALHHAALGGLAIDSLLIANGCRDHDWEVQTSLACAFNEGFASYLALASVGSGVFALEDSVEVNWWLGSEGNDGARQDGSVAAVFWDIDDAGSEPHDALNLSGAYIADVVRTCKVRVGTSWVDRSGIDHLVYCFENRVDSSITGNSSYFSTRATDPTDQRESAVEPSGWTAARIRSIWLRNLYDDP